MNSEVTDKGLFDEGRSPEKNNDYESHRRIHNFSGTSKEYQIKIDDNDNDNDKLHSTFISQGDSRFLGNGDIREKSGKLDLMNYS